MAPLRLDHDYRWWWAGQSVSAFGNHVTRTALRFQIYVMTGSLLAVGALTAVQLVAVLLFSLVGGSIADAVDRRRLLIVAQLGMGGATLGLLLLSMIDDTSVEPLLALSFFSAGLSAVDASARQSAVARLVPRQRLGSAIALNQLSQKGAAIVGPAAAGVLIAVADVQAAYAVDLISFVASLTALAVIAPIAPLVTAAAPGVRAIVDGLRFVMRRRLILSVLMVDLNATVFGTPTALFPALALDVFGVGPEGFGLLSAAPAVGAFAGAALSGWVARVRRTGRAVVLAVAGWGLAITAFGLLTFSFPLALLALATAGAFDLLATVFRATIVQLETPDDYRGRVMGLYSMGAMSGPRLGDVEAALVAEAIGAQLSVISGGVLCLLGLAVVVRAYPELPRHLIAMEAHDATGPGCLPARSAPSRGRDP